MGIRLLICSDYELYTTPHGVIENFTGQDHPPQSEVVDLRADNVLQQSRFTRLVPTSLGTKGFL